MPGHEWMDVLIDGWMDEWTILLPGVTVRFYGEPWWSRVVPSEPLEPFIKGGGFAWQVRWIH